MSTSRALIGEDESGASRVLAMSPGGSSADGIPLGLARTQDRDVLALLTSIDLSLRRIVRGLEVSQSPNLDLEGLVPE